MGVGSDKRESAKPYVLFRDDKSGTTSLFTDPTDLIVAYDRNDFFTALEKIEGAHRRGKWLAGYVSYEAGFLFEPKLAEILPNERRCPLVCFGVFDAATSDGHELSLPPVTHPVTDPIFDPIAGWNEVAYAERFTKLHQHLCLGDAYQANLTMPITARWRSSPREVFWSLIARQPVRYGALVDLVAPTIVSRSPELFFCVDENGYIETHPMKGTAPRGRTPKEDRSIVAAMLADEKTQAENRMIVDLLRNDISRISEVGTLSVPRLFEIETYPTLHQMVSHVRAKLLPKVSVAAIFEALFPSGSITGAPKMRAMEILAGLEGRARDIYCGAIGFINPNGAMQFSVAIRTLSLFDDETVVLNVGGGIVFDSVVKSEFDECLLKARFAVGNQPIAI